MQNLGTGTSRRKMANFGHSALDVCRPKRYDFSKVLGDSPRREAGSLTLFDTEAMDHSPENGYDA